MLSTTYFAADEAQSLNATLINEEGAIDGEFFHPPLMRSMHTLATVILQL